MRLNEEARAVFLDRDGTLNVDKGYTHKIKDWIWLPGVLSGLKLFMRSGFKLIIVSNQSGVARGYYTLQDVIKLENWLEQELESRGISITAWRYCPHMPESGCSCRKPEPGLILAAARDFDINLPASWMLGDRISDVQAGLAAGCNAGLIAYAPDSPEEQQLRIVYPHTPVWSSLEQAARAICALE